MADPANHWRAGWGYLPASGEDEGPPLPPVPPGSPAALAVPGQMFNPMIGFWGPPPPPSGGFWGPPPFAPPGFPGGEDAGPPSFAPPGPALQTPPWGGFPGFLGWPPAPPADGSGDSNGDGKGTKKIPKGLALEGGLRAGMGYLYTGKQLTVHVIDKPCTFVEFMQTTDGYKIHFSIFKISDHASVDNLIDSLEAGKKAKLTQVFETGNGQWLPGTTIQQGSDKAKQTLADLGWSGAGVNAFKEPVWVHLEKV